MKLKIEKLVEGGQGISRENEKSFFVWGALPEEEIEAEIVNKRKGIFETKVINILTPSPHRIEPVENHFLSCSPWAIMDFDYENEMKVAIATETYKRIGNIQYPISNIQSDGTQFGYRNKMEFSFVENEGKISYAFFERGQKKKIAIEGCKLATPAINETAKRILKWVNTNGLTERNLKAVIIRSNMKGEAIAGLFIKDKLKLDCRGLIHQAQKNGKSNLVGFNLYYSTHKSPASVITEVLYQEGQDFLIEEISREVEPPLRFKYGLNSFFQVNIPVFEMALKDITGAVREGSTFVGTRKTKVEPSHLEIVDFYSGVGSIGLCIGASTLIESNEEAVSFAEENIALNKIEGCETVLSPSEKTLDYIQKDSILIFDPPRAGLHGKVVERILNVKPSKIIYLSCNIATQARDISLLKDAYDIKSIKLFNFFPRTPHIEGLCILEIKK